MGKHGIEILHIFNDEKFSHPFFNFLIKKGFSLRDSHLFHYRCKKNGYDKNEIDCTLASSFFSIIPNIKLFFLIRKSEKVIVHSLASPFLLFYIILFPKIGKKIYWVIWGKDLYFYRMLKKPMIHHNIYEFLRVKAIKYISNIVTSNTGDYELARSWYGTNATLHSCFMYPTNLYKNNKANLGKTDNAKINILLGNSADPSNNHIQVLQSLKKYKDKNINIVSPLSYGSTTYAKAVSEYGTKTFGDKFQPIMSLLPYNEYLELLNSIDIGIFAHKRQQAMGNIISLLGAGKKVYIRSDITTWDYLCGMGIVLYDISNLSIEKSTADISAKNSDLIKEIFSEDKLVEQINSLFSHNKELEKYKNDYS